MLKTFWDDAAYGVRLMRRAPGFTAAALVTLSLAIGATTAVFSVVYGVLLRPLGDVVVLMPPLSIKPSEVDFLVDGVRASIEEATG